MKLRITIAGAAVLAALLPAIAVAMPGQSVASFTAWAKANPALHGLTKKIGDMSGLPYYTATFHAGSSAGNFMATVGEKDAIVDESVAVASGDRPYDILKHLDVAAQMLGTVYAPDITADFKDAAKVGSWTLLGEPQATALYRGKQFGYELAYSFVRLIPVAAVDAEAHRLAACVKEQCGD